MARPMHTLLRALAALLCLAAAGCGRNPEKDYAAERSANPALARIVVLSPALGVIAKDLGLEKQIVGRHAFDIVLDKSLPVCGDQSGLDYERLLAAKPTDILLEWGERPLPDRLNSLAKKRHWNIHNYTTLTIDAIVATTDDIDQTFRRRQPPLHPSDAEPPPFSHWLTEALKPKPGHDLSKAGRVLLLESLSPPAALGPGSAHHEVLSRLGGAPAITDGKPFITLDAEAILDLKPDVVIVIAPRPYTAEPCAYTPAEVQTLLGKIGTLDIPATRNQRLALIDHPLALLPSTALIDFARDLERILQPWAK